MTAADRHEALNDLLLLRCEVGDAIAAVNRFPWDSEVELVSLTRADAARVLDAFRSGTLTAGECAAWANAVEGRDDVGLESGAEDVLREFLFELSTPEVTRALTQATARDWLQRLQ